MMDQSKIDAARAKIALGQATLSEGVAELLEATAPVVTPPKPVPTTKVSSLTDLQNALKAAREGEVIQLAKGGYNALTVKGLALRNVRLVGEGATLAGLRILSASGLTVEGIAIAMTPEAGSKVQIDQSSAIALRHMRSGGKDTAYGFSVINSQQVELEACEASNVKDGFQGFNSRFVTILEASAHGFRADGMTMCDVSNLKIIGGEIFDCNPTPTSHNDGIQLHAGSAKAPAENILISGVRVRRGAGRPMQGMLISDQSGIRPYRNIRVEHCIFEGCLANGIGISDSFDVELVGNVVQGFDDTDLSRIVLRKVSGGYSERNRYIALTPDENVTNFDIRDKPTLKAIAPR